MKVLVTGATGFVGRHLVEELRKRGEEAVCLIRGKRDLTNWTNLSNLKIVEGDVTNREAIRKALEGIDVVYHLAAISGKSAVSREDYKRVNVDGVKIMVEEAEAAGVGRFVFVSSAAVTGRLKKVPADETTPYGPTNGYEKSKMMGEKIVLEAIKHDHFPAVIIRPGSIYGPGNESSNMGRLLLMVAKGRVLLPGRGKNRWDMVYIDDVINGLIKAGTIPEAMGQTFIVTGPCPAEVKGIIKSAALANGKKLRIINLPIRLMTIAGKMFSLIEDNFTIPMPFSEKTVQILSEDRYHTSRKAEKILGYKAKVGLEEGMRKTIEWYRKKGLI